LNRRTRFFLGLVLVTLLFVLPAAIAISVKAFQWLVIFLVLYSLGVYQVHRMTIRNIKLKYPLVNPEGHLDIYSGRMPRPIYEDVQRYPRFFNKKFEVAKKKRKTGKRPGTEQ